MGLGVVACLSSSFQPEVGLSLSLSCHSLLPWLLPPPGTSSFPQVTLPVLQALLPTALVDSSLIHSRSPCLSSAFRLEQSSCSALTPTAPPVEPTGALAGAHPPRSSTGPRTGFRPLTCPLCTENACPAVTLTSRTTSRAGILFSTFVPAAPGTELDMHSSSGSSGGGRRGGQMAGRRHAEGRCQSGRAKRHSGGGRWRVGK